MLIHRLDNGVKSQKQLIEILKHSKEYLLLPFNIYSLFRFDLSRTHIPASIAAVGFIASIPNEIFSLVCSSNGDLRSIYELWFQYKGSPELRGFHVAGN